MSERVQWSQIPTSLKVGSGVGLAACAAALAVPFEIKMVFFVVSLFAISLGFRDQSVRQHFRLGGFETVADEDDLGPHPFTTGLALGMMPICVATMVFALWNWFGWKLTGTVAVFLSAIIFQEKIKEAYYFIADRVGEKWYGSKAQEYFLDHQAWILCLAGVAVLVGGLVTVLISHNIFTMFFGIIVGFFGGVVALMGVGVKYVENG